MIKTKTLYKTRFFIGDICKGSVWYEQMGTNISKMKVQFFFSSEFFTQHEKRQWGIFISWSPTHLTIFQLLCCNLATSASDISCALHFRESVANLRSKHNQKYSASPQVTMDHKVNWKDRTWTWIKYSERVLCHTARLLLLLVSKIQLLLFWDFGNLWHSTGIKCFCNCVAEVLVGQYLGKSSCHTPLI